MESTDKDLGKQPYSIYFNSKLDNSHIEMAYC
jgi:hypothetical protein